MKSNVIDIVETVESIISRFNKQNEEAKTHKHYSLRIKNATIDRKQPIEGEDKAKGGKKVKVLELHLNDVETGERLLLFDSTWIPKSPAHILTSNYKVVLYKELFYTLFAFSAIRLEAIKREEATKKAVEVATKLHSV